MAPFLRSTTFERPFKPLPVIPVRCLSVLPLSTITLLFAGLPAVKVNAPEDLAGKSEALGRVLRNQPDEGKFRSASRPTRRAHQGSDAPFGTEFIAAGAGPRGTDPRPPFRCQTEDLATKLLFRGLPWSLIRHPAAVHSAAWCIPACQRQAQLRKLLQYRSRDCLVPLQDDLAWPPHCVEATRVLATRCSSVGSLPLRTTPTRPGWLISRPFILTRPTPSASFWRSSSCQPPR